MKKVLAKPAKKIFKRNNEEKKAWTALVGKFGIVVFRALCTKYKTGRPRRSTKAAFTELLLERLETLPTSVELDEIREANRVPTKDKWLKEHWDNKDFDSVKESLKLRLDAFLRGEPGQSGGPPGLIKDLDIDNWKDKENICMMWKAYTPKFFAKALMKWHWAQVTWITTGNKDLAFKSVQDSIEM